MSTKNVNEATKPFLIKEAGQMPYKVLRGSLTFFVDGPSPIWKGWLMEEMKKENTVQEEQVPYIRCEIDGTVYTVMIHFQPGCKETAKDKVKRLLLKDALAGGFPD